MPNFDIKFFGIKYYDNGISGHNTRDKDNNSHNNGYNDYNNNDHYL
ncbi:unnamed protein product [Medioppia subpectinata]|uniref:Uncharacterized protein n=1 Tax=Medioppia subpectinata TaxID=1979941 RepID=A0A7R9LXF5_9ACAR|nr:unnamed protein product [Medioppia subpectinata]CAG2122490.1 unnamed protein product [Medioppia subpectinata]